MAQLHSIGVASHLCGSSATESGTLETCVQVRNVWIEDAERTISPIYMQPETLIFAEIGQFIERINCAGIDGSSAAHYAKRSSSLFSISHDCLSQSMQIHFVLCIDRNDAWLRQALTGATLS